MDKRKENKPFLNMRYNPYSAFISPLSKVLAFFTERRAKMVKCERICLAATVLIIFSILLSGTNAATITSCALDRTVYNQGETGYISLTVYNDKDTKIRVYEVTATISYFYADGATYLQTFFTNATLPIEICACSGEGEDRDMERGGTKMVSI